MFLNEEFNPPKFKLVNTWMVDPKFRGDANFVQESVMALSRINESVVSAIALFDFSRQQSESFSVEQRWRDSRLFLPNEWERLAASSAAVAAYNFRRALISIGPAVGKIPEWRGIVNLREFGKIEKKFDEEFPEISNIRHSISHPEFYRDPKKNMAVSGPFESEGFRLDSGQIMISEGIVNDKFVCSIDGKYLEFFVNGNSIIKMNAISRLVIKVLTPILHD